eukprot:COSAG04_NODE_534_length_12949_cov_5.651673_4_plen_342_part_00
MESSAVNLLRSAREDAQRRAASAAADALAGGGAAGEPTAAEAREVLRRWRVTEEIQPGGLNVRDAPSKSGAVLLKLPKLTVLEASGDPQGDVTGTWLPIWNPQAPDTRAYSMLEDDAMEERCLEPLDGVTWWRVTERCNPGGLNLRQAPDKASASLGLAPRHTVLKSIAPPTIPAPSGSPYGSLQLRRWRVSTSVAPGCLNCRCDPSKDSGRLLRLPPKTIVEAIGPPQRRESGEWLPISLANVPPKLKAEGALPASGWVILRDDQHKIEHLRGQGLLDPIDGDAPWLKVANPLRPGTSAYCLMHDIDAGERENLPSSVLFFPARGISRRCFSSVDLHSSL